MGILCGFAPWIVFWILIGNVPYLAATLVALAVAVAAAVLARSVGSPGRTLEIGSVATFVVLAVLCMTASPTFLEQWLKPLGNMGIFVVALITAVAGRPFVREFAVVGQPKEVIESDTFARITAVLTWVWIAAFGGMAVSSAVPPLVDAGASIRDAGTPLSVVCYWVIPFSLLALAALVTRILPDRMVPPAEEIVRRTTFVAFSEAEIDQLMYLATEHANREVGPGKEVYDIRIGSKGVPLVGDETRQSWPSSYKVRDRKR